MTTQTIRHAVLLAGLLWLSATVGPAAAAPPPDDVSASPSGASTAAARTFSWSAVAPETPDGTVTYEGGVTTDAGAPGSPSDFGTATSVPLDVPEGLIWFHVRSVERTADGAVPLTSEFSRIGPFVSDRTAPRITVSQRPAANPRGWTRELTTLTFSCSDANPGPDGWCPAPVVLGEGIDQVVTGTATDALGQQRTTTRTVDVDLTPAVGGDPVAPAEGATISSTRPEFSWSPATDALSGVQYYEVHVIGRGKVGSASARSTRLVSSQTLPVGPVRWYVRTVDNANNATVSRQAAFTIDPTARSQTPDPSPTAPGGSAAGTAGASAPPAPVVRPPGPGSRRARPAMFNARELLPRAGVRLPYLRPVLRWTRGPRTTQLYNVQVFEIRGRAVKKVLTAFPRGTRYRIPGGVLRRERRYVWRVWPYASGRYTPRPKGVSYFDIRLKPRTPAG